MRIDTNEYLHHLDKVCSDYNMSALDVYTVLISKNDQNFPLSFETIQSKTLKYVSCEILKKIFTSEELKSIFEGTFLLKKIKNKETRNFIKTL